MQQAGSDAGVRGEGRWRCDGGSLPRACSTHLDRGAQCTSLRFGACLRAAGILPSMGCKGDAYDNAVCEAFFATLERGPGPVPVPDPGGSPFRAVQLGGSLLQPLAPTLSSRLPVPRRVREKVVQRTPISRRYSCTKAGNSN